MFSDWKQAPIKELIAVEFPGEWGTEPEGIQGNVKVLRSTNIDDDGHVDYDTGAERNVSRSRLDAKRLMPGDILLEASGGSTEKPVGRVASFEPPDERDYLVSNFFRTLRPVNGVEPRFLMWKLLQLYREPAIWNFQQQTTGIKNLKLSDYLKHEIAIPVSPNEQRRMADILDTADGAIRHTEAVIAKLKAMKAGLLHDLLTRGLDENGELRDPVAHPEHFKGTQLGLIPREWTMRQLGEIAAVDRGKFTHRPRNDPLFYGGPYPFIQTGDVAEAEGRVLTSYSQTLSERGVAVSLEFPIDTIAITIAANIADTAILGIPMYFPDSVVGAVVRQPHNVRYVELCIRRAKAILDALAPQSAQKNINLQDLRPLAIPVPTPQEQDRIAQTYEALDTRISAEETTHHKLRLLKQGLMGDLLTGQVRVNQLLGKSVHA